MTPLVWSGAMTFCEAAIWSFMKTFGQVPHPWLWAAPAFVPQFGLAGPLTARRLG